MKHVGSSRAWRPVRPRSAPGLGLGALSALVFNLCLLLLPAAGASAFFVVSRDQLYAYELSPAGQRAVRHRVERLAGDLIQLDFDRHQQWDDLVAMQLMNNDVAAARGFLLSARRMLPPQDANQLDHRVRADAPDAEIELAALDLLTPGTRARYEAIVPLLARRSASGAGDRLEPGRFTVLGDQRDFEILAQAVLQQSEGDPVHFVLTGLGLGLGGDFTPRMAAGASALIVSSRRQDYPSALGQEIRALVGSAVSAERFRSEALRLANGADAAAYPNAAAAFRAAVAPSQMAALKSALDQIGAMGNATSTAGASVLLTHARNLRDIPRLRLVAQAAGDRAIAVAKGVARDGALAVAARGELTFSRDLTTLIGIAGLALAALFVFAGLAIMHLARRAWAHFAEDPDGGELVESFRGAWTPL